MIPSAFRGSKRRLAVKGYLRWDERCRLSTGEAGIAGREEPGSFSHLTMHPQRCVRTFSSALHLLAYSYAPQTQAGDNARCCHCQPAIAGEARHRNAAAERRILVSLICASFRGRMAAPPNRQVRSFKCIISNLHVNEWQGLLHEPRRVAHRRSSQCDWPSRPYRS